LKSKRLEVKRPNRELTGAGGNIAQLLEEKKTDETIETTVASLSAACKQ
jgi:hypothetical protein